MKNLLRLVMASFAIGVVFLNVTVVQDSKSESNFKLSALSEVFAQTESAISSVASSTTSSAATSSVASSLNSSAISSTPPSGEPPVPSSWIESNPWGTGVGYYRVPRMMTAGMTLTDTSTDGGLTWRLSSVLPSSGTTYGPSQGSGSNLTRTVTFLVSYTIMECRLGGTERCDGPTHIH